MNQNLGQHIKLLRKEFGISQEDLAQEVGVSRQAISKWECDEAVPELNNLSLLATRFNVTVDELINGDGGSGTTKVPLIKLELKVKAQKYVVTSIILYVVMLVLISVIPLPEAIIALFFGATSIVIVGLLVKASQNMQQYRVANNIKEDKDQINSIKAYNKRRRSLVSAVFLTTLTIYLYLGVTGGFWSPTWLIFMIIPIAHLLFNAFVKRE